jgi:hypothetical protein
MSCRSDPPSPASGPSSLSSPIASCPLSQSEIILLDEIGLPFRNAAVVIHITGQGPLNTTTDGDGKICLNLPPGTVGEVELAAVHETASGDATTTASGTHFALNGTGP